MLQENLEIELEIKTHSECVTSCYTPDEIKRLDPHVANF